MKLYPADFPFLLLEQVTYVRIRPPAPGAVVSQNNHQEGMLLLSKLNKRLYQIETDQPVSPMSDGGSLVGRSFSDVLDTMTAATSGEPLGTSPAHETVEETILRSITSSASSRRTVSAWHWLVGTVTAVCVTACLCRTCNTSE